MSVYIPLALPFALKLVGYASLLARPERLLAWVILTPFRNDMRRLLAERSKWNSMDWEQRILWLFVTTIFVGIWIGWMSWPTS